jgi:hypothetical protein
MKMSAILDKAKHDIENMRLKLGGGQAYDRSSDQTTVVAKATGNKGIICCTEPGLTEALYILYIHLLPCIKCKIVNIFYIMISNLLLQTMTRPILSLERAPHKDRTVTVKQ